MAWCICLAEADSWEWKFPVSGKGVQFEGSLRACSRLHAERQLRDQLKRKPYKFTDLEIGLVFESGNPSEVSKSVKAQEALKAGVR